MHYTNHRYDLTINFFIYLSIYIYLFFIYLSIYLSFNYILPSTVHRQPLNLTATTWCLTCQRKVRTVQHIPSHDIIHAYIHIYIHTYTYIHSYTHISIHGCILHYSTHHIICHNAVSAYQHYRSFVTISSFTATTVIDV